MKDSERMNAFSFYSMTVISFLETAVPNYVENLSPYFSEHPEAQHWLQAIWLPEETEHGCLARAYTVSRWPEFDWERGYTQFLSAYRPRCAQGLLRPSPALEALARCVTETEAAMIYRCLADYSSDPELKALLQGMSKDEVRHYSYFRDLFNYYEKREENSFWQKAGVVVARSELVRDEDLALAYQPLNGCWSGEMPFVPLSYPQFLTAMAKVMARHFPFEQAKRMLFRPLRGDGWLDSLLVEFLTLIVRRPYVAPD